MANNLLVCRNCAFNFDTPGIFSDVDEVVDPFFLCFEGRWEEEAFVREGPIRDRVERNCNREKNSKNPGSSLLPLPLCISRLYSFEMRNLGLRAVQNIALPNVNTSAVAIDPEEDAIYVASERQNADDDIEVEIFKIELQQSDSAVRVPRFKLCAGCNRLTCVSLPQ